MKSAYEKAMERLERDSGPTRKLTDEQKSRIADIDRKYDAQAAEQRLSFENRLLNAASQAEAGSILLELANELAFVESRRQEAKEAVWGEGQG